jgi:hypothetical protein
MSKDKANKTETTGPAKSTLYGLLQKYPGLEDKLIEALETRRFFIALSCQKKDNPDDPHDLRHSWHREGFNQFDVVKSLKHIAADWCAKENPMAQIEGEGWH